MDTIGLIGVGLLGSAIASRLSAKAPLSQVHRQLLERLEAAGYGDVDNSAIIMAYE